MPRLIATIARYTLIEALRTRLPLLVVLAILALSALSAFGQQLAIAESARFQIGIYAAGVRLASVFIAGLYVLASMAREFDDRGLDMVLALDLPRAHYLLGKLAGFLTLGILVAAAVTVPLALTAPLGAALQWGISLALELAVVIAFALFCIVSLGQVTLAAALMVGFYLLGRTLTAMRLMGANPIAGGDSLAHQVMHWMTEGLALLLPAFDGWTRTEWVADAPAGWLDIAVLAGHGTLYVVLLAAASMFDFYRRNF
jgi:ABC-type transport system involved in multi-copper enzyme maturation permease subunit